MENGITAAPLQLNMDIVGVDRSKPSTLTIPLRQLYDLLKLKKKFKSLCMYINTQKVFPVDIELWIIFLL